MEAMIDVALILTITAVAGLLGYIVADLVPIGLLVASVGLALLGWMWRVFRRNGW